MGRRLSQHLGLPHADDVTQRFSDGELRVHLPIENHDTILLVQSLYPPVHEHLMELLLLADAAKRYGAQRIIAIIPYMGYSRQNTTTPGTSASGHLVFHLLKTAGVHEIITLDLHAPQSYETLFPVYNVDPAPLLYGQKDVMNTSASWVFVAPDKGSIPRVHKAAQHCGGDDTAVVIMHKNRTTNNSCTITGMEGHVQGKKCMILDDIVDTGKTLCNTAELLKKRGAQNIWAFITHGVFSGDAAENIQKSGVEKIFLTNSIPFQKKHTGLFHMLDSSHLLTHHLHKILPLFPGRRRVGYCE